MQKKISNPVFSTTMSTDFEFNGCIHDGERLYFSKWILTLSMSPRTLRKGETKIDLQKKMAVSFMKISTWIQYFLSDVFIVDASNTKLIESLYSIDMDNPVMMVPGIPSEGLLVQLLHSKVIALSKGDLIIEDAQVSEVDGDTSFYFDPAYSKSDLPNQKEFVGLSALHSKPWWERYDCDTYDLQLPKGVKRKDMISEVDTSSFLDELERNIMASYTGSTNNTPTGADVVNFPVNKNGSKKWSPKET